jgi:hypothetical protein
MLQCKERREDAEEKVIYFTPLQSSYRSIRWQRRTRHEDLVSFFRFAPRNAKHMHQNRHVFRFAHKSTHSALLCDFNIEADTGCSVREIRRDVEEGGYIHPTA